MRTLSSTLLLKQKAQAKLSPPVPKLWKIILSRAGEITKGYDNSRLQSCTETFEPSSQKAEIILRNSDKALTPSGTPIDFENYQTTIFYGFRTRVTRTAWTTKSYALDDIVVPTTANGYQYRCAVAGTSSGTEPVAPTNAWPTDLGVRITDGTVTWEMDGNSGDEYSYDAPMKVRVQEYHSGRGILKCILRTIGIPDQLKEDKAIAEYTQTSSDTNTVKTLIDAVCAAGSGLGGAYNGYTAITVVYDTASPYDGILDTFILADYFSISINESRWDKIEELLEYTRCKKRIGNDGKLHIFVPITSGKTWATATAYVVNDYVQATTSAPNLLFAYKCTTAGTSTTEPTWPTVAGNTVTEAGSTLVWTAVAFDYEYKYKISGDHTFFNKTVRLRFVEPNKEIVSSSPDHSPQYSGGATSATSYALDPKTRTTYRRLASSTQAGLIAAALIERNELDAEKGFATVPMNVGQELWDYVKVTDSRQSDTRIGNIQYLSKTVKKPEGSEGLTFSMALSFGKVTMQSIMSNLISAGGAGGVEVAARLTNDEIYALIDDLANDIYRDLNGVIKTLNSLIKSYNELDTVPKWHVTKQMIIPVV